MQNICNERRYVHFLWLSEFMNISRYFGMVMILIHFFYQPLTQIYFYTSLIIVSFAFRLAEIYIKPTYFRLTIDENSLTVYVISFRYNSLWLWWWKKHKLIRASTTRIEAFNGFELQFRKAGWQRWLILHQQQNNVLLKSMPYNISLLSIQDYTRLIILLDEITCRRKHQANLKI